MWNLFLIPLFNPVDQEISYKFHFICFSIFLLIVFS